MRVRPSSSIGPKAPRSSGVAPEATGSTCGPHDTSRDSAVSLGLTVAPRPAHLFGQLGHRHHYDVFDLPVQGDTAVAGLLEATQTRRTAVSRHHKRLDVKHVALVPNARPG